MRKYKSILDYNLKDILISKTCDICKKEFRVDIDDFEIQEFFSFNAVGGYGSVFGDGDEIKFDICQHCMKKFLEEHK